MIKLLLITSAVAMAPRASRPKKIRGVREDRWSFDILTRWKKEGEHAQIVATDPRGDVGWFEVLRSRGGNVLHAPLKNEPVVERAFGTNVMVEPDVRKRGVASTAAVEHEAALEAVVRAATAVEAAAVEAVVEAARAAVGTVEGWVKCIVEHILGLPIPTLPPSTYEAQLPHTVFNLHRPPLTPSPLRRISPRVAYQAETKEELKQTNKPKKLKLRR